MNDSLLSVIIPVYNAEKYLTECLESVVKQTIFEQIEVVAVNDGSNAPGSTDTIPRAIEIGIAMIRQIKKSKNTTAADIYFSSFSSPLRITILNSMIQRWTIRNATKTKLNSGAA